VFTYVHFRHLGELKMRFLFDETFLKILYVVKDVECTCVGIRKIYEYHVSPTLIIDKNLI